MPEQYNTKTRTAVSNFLKQQDTACTAAEIFSALRSKGENINITTVYRTLDRLANEKIVLKNTMPDGKTSAYKYIGENPECRRHLHLQCTKCGKILHLDCDYMNGISNHIFQKHGFTLLCENSVLHGLCSECKNSVEDRN